ncbi:glutamine synthetase [Caerostris extrusa]|uniref:Glutamine synthetase n=1 Tax=Caerostris extrusa TaxID=172846 RepID=A0AAV4QNJ3_CAEEX|nr:glutamine synthetase [Caerostris extrusa]
MNLNSKLLTQTFLELKQPEDKIQCMYIWIDGSLKNFRTKTKTWPEDPQTPNNLPVMEFCGSATDFDVGDVADYYAKPVKLYKDPFRGGCNRLVFCETYSRERLPTFANNRYRLLASTLLHEPFTFFQTYSLLRKDGKPLCYMDPAYTPDSQFGFACGKYVAEGHYKACLYAGVSMSSLESVSYLGQWRYSIGSFSSAVELGDDVWMSRFLLLRVAEDFDVVVNFEKDQASFWMDMENVSAEKRMRTADSLLSKFVIKEHKPVRIQNFHNRIVLNDLQPDIDPYSLCKKTIEAFNTLT